MIDKQEHMCHSKVKSGGRKVTPRRQLENKAKIISFVSK